MLSYPKSLTVPEFTRENKTFTVFTKSRKDTNSAVKNAVLYEECLNFTCRGNALVAEIGCEAAWNNPMAGFKNVATMCVYNQVDKGKGVAFALVDEVHFAYGNTGKEPLFWGEYTFTDPVMLAHSSLSGAQFLLVGGREGVYVYYDRSLHKLSDFPDAKAAVWCNERVFVLSYQEKNRIYYSSYSATDEPAYVSLHEYLELEPNDGEIEDMTVCSDTVCLLRQNKVTKIKTNELDDGFTVEDISCSFGTPIARSLRCCNGKLVFVCDDGLYIMSDDTMQKASLPFEFSSVTGKAYSGTFGRYYFFSYTGTDGVRTLFYSPDTEEYALTDFAVTAPAEDGEECFFFRNGALCALNRKSTLHKGKLKKVWKSVPTDFSLGAGRKLLRSVTLRGEGKITLTVTSNTGMGGTYTVDLTDGEGKAEVLLKGEKFSLAVESEDTACRIEGMDIEADVYGEGSV